MQRIEVACQTGKVYHVGFGDRAALATPSIADRDLMKTEWRIFVSGHGTNNGRCEQGFLEAILEKQGGLSGSYRQSSGNEFNDFSGMAVASGNCWHQIDRQQHTF